MVNDRLMLVSAGDASVDHAALQVDGAGLRLKNFLEKSWGSTLKAQVQWQQHGVCWCSFIHMHRCFSGTCSINMCMYEFAHVANLTLRAFDCQPLLGPLPAAGTQLVL